MAGLIGSSLPHREQPGQSFKPHTCKPRLVQAARPLQPARATGLKEVAGAAKDALKRTISGVAKPEELPPTDGAIAPDSATEVDVPVAKSVDLDRGVLFQAFGWDSCQKGGWWKTLKGQVQDIKAAGVTHVWLPPPSQSVAPEGYLPGQLYNLNSKYGNKEELVALTSELKKAGLVPICDIVINHRCANKQDENGLWNKWIETSPTGETLEWGKWAITGNDPDFGGTGNPDTGDDYGPAPDLDHMNEDLRSHLIDWLNWLKTDIGFEGWRFDFVKGYAPNFIHEYITKTVGEGTWNVGEFWADLRWNDGGELDYNQDEARQKLVDWVGGAQRTSNVFDFPHKGIFQFAVERTQYWRLKDPEGKAPGVLGWWPSKAVTFVDNHDTGSTQRHWPFPEHFVDLGYAYYMTHPGSPSVFYDHLWGHHGDKIRQLIELRKRNNLHCRSKLDIRTADADLYFAVIDDRVALKMGPRHDIGNLVPREEDGWRFALSGNDFAVWERASA